MQGADVLKIHTSDGQTHRVDLADPEQAKHWVGRLSKDDFQASIKGVSLVERHAVSGKCQSCGKDPGRSVGVQYSVTRPDDFDRVFFHVEEVPAHGRVKGGERATVFIDDVRLVLMAHHSQPAARIQVSKVGKQKFNPYKRIGSGG